MPYSDPEVNRAYDLRYYQEHRDEKSAYRRSYYEEHRDEAIARAAVWRQANLERHREITRLRYAKLREEAIVAYGGKCACCGEFESRFLTIDHIDDDGAQHRKQIGASRIYIWLKKNGYPDRFQVLCYNCNCGRQLNGGVCPHQDKGEDQLCRQVKF